MRNGACGRVRVLFHSRNNLQGRTISHSKHLVLLVTHSGDLFTVDRVAEGIVRRGGIPVRIDTDRFPTEVRLGV